MKKTNFFRKIYYSIICKKYKEMIEEKSGYAILYLAILEFLFTIVISAIVAKNFLQSSFKEMYEYALNFLVDFFDNSLSLTFNSILVLSVLGYVLRLITRKKVKYSKMFCLATYSSTLAMVLKYIVFVVSYTKNIEMPYFSYIYFGIVTIYFIINFRKI